MLRRAHSSSRSPAGARVVAHRANTASRGAGRHLVLPHGWPRCFMPSAHDSHDILTRARCPHTTTGGQAPCRADHGRAAGMLHMSLLGEKTIADETGVLTSSSRALALIAFLAAHPGSPQARQRIAGLFWPESPDPQALTNLRRELHHLRRLLGREHSLVVTSTDLCWRDTPTCRVDMRVFSVERDAALAAAAAGDDAGVLEHATRALAQYKGELVPGVYDDWLLGARQELERQCVDMCDLVCATWTRTGDLSGAVDAARRRIQLQPLEEVGYRTLMRLQADLGDRAGAVSTYHHCASVLERELGVSPDPATQQAFRRLMATADPAGARWPAAGPAISRSGYVAATLVGRSAELSLLQDLWQTAAAGQPGLALAPGRA